MLRPWRKFDRTAGLDEKKWLICDHSGWVAQQAGC